MILERIFINNDDFKLIQPCVEESVFGIVHKVEYKKDKKIYAAKIFKTEKGFGPEEQMLFMRELSIISNLHHPAIVKFIGTNFQSFEDPTKLKPSIITEYLVNGSLKKVFDNERTGNADFKWDSTKKHICLLGIADAMRNIHKNQILHRDLKPENILLDDNYYPRVCDFGLSRYFPNELTNSVELEMTQKFGTLKYNAPEVIEGDGKYGLGVDVYSFGIIAYEISTCKVAFSELGKISPINFGIKICDGYTPQLDETDLTDKMKELIIKCLNKKPEARPSFEEIVSLLSNDFTYLDGFIDEDEIKDYIEVLQENNDSFEIQKNKLIENDENKYFDLLINESSIFEAELSNNITKILNDNSLNPSSKMKICLNSIKSYYVDKINELNNCFGNFVNDISNLLFNQPCSLKNFHEKKIDKLIISKIQKIIKTNTELTQQNNKYKQMEEEQKHIKQESKNDSMKETEKIEIKQHIHDKIKVEGEQKKSDVIQPSKNEIEHQKSELSEKKNDHTKHEIKRYAQDIIVCGRNNYNQLGQKASNKNKYGIPIISPPNRLSIDFTSIKSFSAYHYHSVIVKDDNKLYGIGYNNGGRIGAFLPKVGITQFMEFSTKDDKGYQLIPISAACSFFGTLYLFKKSNGSRRRLVYCDKDIKGGNPVFLNICHQMPVALFSGLSNFAAISNDGAVIFINRNSVIQSPESKIKTVFLPDGEKATSIACCEDSVIVLSSNGRVFSSPIEHESSVLKFSAVLELIDEEIVYLSGTCIHCLAVSKNGYVFGRGSNQYGQLGFSKEISRILTFTKISSIHGYEIREAYAGYSHSLFVTKIGKILTCGSNVHGELLLKSGPGENSYSPTETVINGGATFCIAGNCFSMVFIQNEPPVNTPNKPIKL